MVSFWPCPCLRRFLLQFHKALGSTWYLPFLQTPGCQRAPRGAGIPSARYQTLLRCCCRRMPNPNSSSCRCKERKGSFHCQENAAKAPGPRTAVHILCYVHVVHTCSQHRPCKAHYREMFRTLTWSSGGMEQQFYAGQDKHILGNCNFCGGVIPPKQISSKRTWQEH